MGERRSWIRSTLFIITTGAIVAATSMVLWQLVESNSVSEQPDVQYDYGVTQNVPTEERVSDDRAVDGAGVKSGGDGREGIQSGAYQTSTPESPEARSTILASLLATTEAMPNMATQDAPASIATSEAAFLSSDSSRWKAFMAAQALASRDVTSGPAYPEYEDFMLSLATLAVTSTVPFPYKPGIRSITPEAASTWTVDQMKADAYTQAFVDACESYAYLKDYFDECTSRAAWKYPMYVSALVEVDPGVAQPIALQALDSPNVFIAIAGIDVLCVHKATATYNDVESAAYTLAGDVQTPLDSLAFSIASCDDPDLDIVGLDILNGDTVSWQAAVDEAVRLNRRQE